jgi:hypothetical protein
MKHPWRVNGTGNPTAKGGASQMTSDPRCPYCGGTGEVKGVIDDVEFIYQCSCSGGREESVRWLLGLNEEPPPGQDLTI